MRTRDKLRILKLLRQYLLEPNPDKARKIREQYRRIL